MNEKIAVVGDIHGDAGRLEKMLGILSLAERRTIFVGDYINRGPDSADVIELLLRAQHNNPDRYVFLMGNHELALLKFLERGEFVKFASLGGISTIRSYVGKTVYGDVRNVLTESIPQSHKAFLESLEVYWEADDLLVSHTGYNPDEPVDRGLDNMVAKGHPGVFKDSSPPVRLTVCGHYLQKNGKPFIGDHLLCIDTGCGTSEGPLTCVLLPEGEFLIA